MAPWYDVLMESFFCFMKSQRSPKNLLTGTWYACFHHDTGRQIWSGCLLPHQATGISCPLDTNGDYLSPWEMFQPFPYNSWRATARREVVRCSEKKETGWKKTLNNFHFSWKSKVNLNVSISSIIFAFLHNLPRAHAWGCFSATLRCSQSEYPRWPFFQCDMSQVNFSHLSKSRVTPQPLQVHAYSCHHYVTH